MSEIAIYFAISIIVLIILSFIIRNAFHSDPNPIPGPACSKLLGTLLGNLELFWTLSDCLKDPQTKGFELLTGITKAYQQCNQNTGLFSARIGPLERVVVFYRADTIEFGSHRESPRILVCKGMARNRSSDQVLDHWKQFFIYHHFDSTGNKWRSRRKLLTPSFHFKILEDFVPIINGQLKIMIDIIDKKIEPNGKSAVIDDIRPIVTNCTLDIICETAMGLEVDAQINSDSEYVQSIRQVLTMFFNRFLSPWLWNDFIYRLSSSGKEFNKLTKILHKFTDSVIKERKNELISKKKIIEEVKVSEGGIDRKTKQAFMDVLLSHHLNGEELDEKGIREEVDTFMFEGHDTTSSGVQFALLLIGLHPEVQSKIGEELEQIFGDNTDRDITLDDIKEMKYLEQSVKESLRLYPPVPYIGRYTREPLKVGEYVIPAKTTCLVLFYMLHRDPKVFDRPEVFDPTRFDRSNGFNAYAFLPFSAGPRNCIGQKFALLEEKAVLASILRKYRIRTLVKRDELEMDIAAILKPRSKITIEFERRF